MWFQIQLVHQLIAHVNLPHLMQDDHVGPACQGHVKLGTALPTFHLLNENTLRQMKAGAWLINAARGAVVSNKDLKSG